MDNMLTEKKEYSWNGTDWNTTDVATYYWSEQKTTGIVGAGSACPLQVYPNPTKDILHIVSDDAGASTQALPLQIYNIAGQSVGANLRVCPNDNVI